MRITSSFTAFITYTSVFRPERRRRLLSLVQLYGEGNNTILGQRSDAAHRTFQLLAAYLDYRLAAGGNTVAVRVGYLTLYLEVAQIGDDGNLRTFRHLRTDLVVYVSEDCLAGRADLRIVQRAFRFGKRLPEDAGSPAPAPDIRHPALPSRWRTAASTVRIPAPPRCNSALPDALCR